MKLTKLFAESVSGVDTCLFIELTFCRARQAFTLKTSFTVARRYVQLTCSHHVRLRYSSVDISQARFSSQPQPTPLVSSPHDSNLTFLNLLCICSLVRTPNLASSLRRTLIRWTTPSSSA